MSTLFRTNEAAGCRMTRGFKKLHVESVNTEVYRKSFAIRGTQDWNSIAEDTRNVQSITVFKKCIKQHLEGQIV